MARGSATAQQEEPLGLSFANQAGANANSLYSTLAPELRQEAISPPGMAPTDLAAINTAGQQSAGGGEAAAVGQGALKNARTRNAGGADAAVADAARTSGETLSKGALGTQIMNARLKETQKQEGLGGLEHMYGENLSAEPASLNATTGAVNANTQAANESWDWAKYILDPELRAASSGAAAGG